jgi:hypothetical protein
MPWLVKPGSDIISFPHSGTFHLPEGTCYHNSYGEWILLSREDDTWFLMSPFTEDTMEIPSLSSYSPYYEPVEIVGMLENEKPGTWMEYTNKKKISVLTLIVCSTDLIAAIVAIGGFGRRPGRIALCRPGSSAWSVSAYEQCMDLVDMVFFQGKIYAIGAGSQDLLAMDIVHDQDNGKPRVSRIECIVEGEPLPLFFPPNGLPS